MRIRDGRAQNIDSGALKSSPSPDLQPRREDSDPGMDPKFHTIFKLRLLAHAYQTLWSPLIRFYDQYYT